MSYTMGLSSFDIARGIDPNWSQDIKFGYNETVGTGAFEPIWAPSIAFTPLTAVAAFEVVSSDAADASGGTGAITIEMLMINSSFDYETVTATLTGTTVVALTGPYLACNRAFVTTAGSNNTNVGNITIRVASGGATQAYIPAGTGQTQQAIVRVPRNHRCYVDGYRIGVKSNQVADFRGAIRVGTKTNGAMDGGLGPYRAAVTELGLINDVGIAPRNWRVLDEGSLLWAEGRGVTTAASMSCNFDYLLERYK